MKLAIYYFEQPSRHGGTHAFLGLVKEEKGRDPKLLQELHFKPLQNNERKPLRAGVYRTSRKQIPDLLSWPHLVGEVHDILQRWNAALEAAALVDEKGYKFQNDHTSSFNCRAGAIASLRAAGLDFVNIVPCEAGTQAEIWEEIKNKIKHEPHNLETIEAKNNLLVDQLDVASLILKAA